MSRVWLPRGNVSMTKGRTRGHPKMPIKGALVGGLPSAPTSLGPDRLWGIASIARYLGYRSVKTVKRFYEEKGLFMWLDQHPGSGRLMWWSHPMFVNAWLLSRCGLDRKEYMARKRERARARGNFDGEGGERKAGT